jgi:hypothetical protein
MTVPLRISASLEEVHVDVARIMRVLLVTPPAPRADAASNGAVGATEWTGLAASLRAVGLQTEVYDAAGRGRDLESVQTHIEHYWPQVVVTRADATTAPAAWAVLRAAKRIVPEVVTVMSGGNSYEEAGRALPRDVVDHDLRGAGEEAEVALIARLRDDATPEAGEALRTRRRAIHVLSAVWSVLGHGR